MTLPILHREDVREALKEMYGAGREHHLFAFYGTGEREFVKTDFAGPVEIVPVRSELELRKHLPALEDEQARVVYLVPWRGEVPMDLRGRFAKNGVVRAIGKEQRVRRIFGVERVDDDVSSSPLVGYLLTPGAPERLPCRKSTLTVDEMWSAWLMHEWGSGIDEELALDSLLAWAALDIRGPAWKAKLIAAGAEDVLTALASYLVQKRGDAAGAVLGAWLRGQGARPLELGLVCQPLLPLGQGVWIRARLKTDLEVTGDELAMKVAGQLSAAVPTALREMDRRSSSAQRMVRERADKLVDDGEVRALLIESPFLPSAWRIRLDELGRTLLSAAQKPGAEPFAEALRALDRLEKHELFKDEAVHATVERADKALRLLAWVCSDQSDLDPIASEPEYAQVERLGRWYVEEGGFVDWARRVARGASKTLFDQGIQAVVKLADERRQELDLRFARALPRWLSAKRPSTQVVPIEDVSKRVIGPFLDGKPDRSLLVLLMDGMAWAQAIEILLSLHDQPEQWGPIAWHTGKHSLGDAAYPVIAAGFPTVTEISRSAFFAGKAMVAGRDHSTDKDPERWRDNANVAKYAKNGDWPRLLLRGEGHEVHGVASEAALSLIGDRTRRVVSLVINAIDAALKGDSQQWHPWRYENVRSLPDILTAAREAGRTVLLASDHGHVPCDRMHTSAGAITGGARWRPLPSRDEVVAPCEVKLFGDGVWTPKGATALALIADDAHRYGGGAHAGEHGGATLAEVIAPCLLVRWEDPLGAQHDPALTARPLVTPPWWYREIQASVQPTAAPKQRKPTPTPVNTAQLGLPEISLPAAPVAPPVKRPSVSELKPVLSPAMLALSEVAVIKDLPRDRRDRLLRALDFLLQRQGLAKLDAFAGHLGLPPFRAGGFIANEMSPVLNVDGYQVLSYDDTHVRLDREKMAQQLEVTL
ncbi:MAG: bacteriophage (phiC31) resistance pglZ [Pseudomonadota bacterium]